MSSPDRRAGALAVLAAGVLLGLGGCASDAGPTAQASGAVPADEVTQRLAEVEAARQCAVSTQTFADEAAITTDLDDRLTAAGLTHAEWKDWHDALVDSPDLVTQLAQATAAGCAGA